jgi:hypothetical protein
LGCGEFLLANQSQKGGPVTSRAGMVGDSLERTIRGRQARQKGISRNSIDMMTTFDLFTKNGRRTRSPADLCDHGRADGIRTMPKRQEQEIVNLE